jgi:CubicO group peptidase (beta-lactamase class C family)
VSGDCYLAPGFEAVGDAFAANFAAGLDVGASSAVVRNGQLVVDLWGGHADKARARPVGRDTLMNVWSVSKGVTATCIALLVERGKLDYEEKVARYWPAFGAAGKDHVTLAQLMSHQAGVPGVRQAITVEDYYAHDRLAALLAQEEPFFEPGSTWGYHTLSLGTLADEVIRRVDGRTAAIFFAEEIAAPLDLDIHMGVSDADAARLSQMMGPESQVPVDPAPVLNEAAAHASMANPALDAEWANTLPWQKAGLPAGGASANARSLARLFALLAQGGSLDGTRLLSPATIAAATHERVSGVDQCIGNDRRYGAGYALNSHGRMGPNPRAFGHGGWGGSMAFADPDAKLGVAFVVNQMRTGDANAIDRRLERLLAAVYDAPVLKE